jgi:hypothetical protein
MMCRIFVCLFYDTENGKLNPLSEGIYDRGQFSIHSFFAGVGLKMCNRVLSIVPEGRRPQQVNQRSIFKATSYVQSASLEACCPSSRPSNSVVILG